MITCKWFNHLTASCLFIAFPAFAQSTAATTASTAPVDQGIAPEAVTVEDIELDPGASTLIQIVNSALRQHPRISAQRSSLDASIADYQAEKGGLRPQVRFELGAGGEYLDPNDRDIYETARAEFTITQMLYDGHETRSSIERAQRIATLRYFELEETMSDMALAIVNAYENVVRYRRLMELSKESYRLNYNIYQQVSRQVASGVVPPINYEQMVGRLALAESNLMVDASNLRDIIIRYQNLVGETAPLDLNMSRFQENYWPARLTEFDESYWPESLGQMLEAAYQHSAFLMTATADVSIRESDFQIARSTSRPEVFLRGRQGWYRNAGGFDSRDTEIGSRSSIELVVSMDLFTGGSNSSRARSALSTLAESQDSQLNICLDLRQRVERAFFERVRLREQTAALRNHERAADQVRLAYRAQFDIGQRTLLEILDIETEYLDAARSRINGEHDLNQATASGLHHSGLLLDALSLKGRQLPELQDLDLAAPSRRELHYCQAQPSVESLSFENLLASLQEPLSARSAEASGSQTSPVETLSADQVFVTGVADLTPAGRTSITRLAQLLEEGEIILVEVHSDSVGSAGRNQVLSQARAGTIKELLIRSGVPETNIIAVGLGSTQPLDTTNSTEAREANRRVEIYFKGSAS